MALTAGKPRLLDIAAGPQLLLDPPNGMWSNHGKVGVLSCSPSLCVTIDCQRRIAKSLKVWVLTFCHVPSKLQPVDLRVATHAAAPDKVPINSVLDPRLLNSDPCSSALLPPYGPEQMLFVELCCGAAVLSKAAQRVGFRVFPVDCDKRRAPYKKTVFLDLANPGQRQVVKDRQKRIKWLRVLQLRLVVLQAKPETNRFHHGKLGGSTSLCLCDVLSILTENQTFLPKTAARSSLQTTCTAGCRTSCNMHATWGSCASWKIPSQAGAGSPPFFLISWSTQDLDLTRTSTAVVMGDFVPNLPSSGQPKMRCHPLAATCDNTRPRKPWKPMLKGNRLRFVTKDKAQYPELLCVRLVSELVQFHFPHLEHQTLQHQCRADPASATRLVLGKQPRGNKLKPLVSEFFSYIFSVSPVASQSVNALLAQPAKGARIVHRWLLKFAGGALQRA